MEFSVLVSVYKKENPIFLEESLNSILSQSLCPTEVVLVKDGPLTLELDDVIRKYDDLINLKIISLEYNSGLGIALNKGLEYCSYEIVARMDTDDIAKYDRFEKQIAILKQYPNIDVVGSWVNEFVGKSIDNIVSVRKLPENSNDIYIFAKRRNPINHPTVMFRKNAVYAAGGYQDFPLFEDYYLWIRMLVKGYSFYNIPQSLLYFRTSTDVYKRRGGWKYAINECRLRRKMLCLNLISRSEFWKEMPLRFLIRIVPSFVRKYFYLKVLR